MAGAGSFDWKEVEETVLEGTWSPAGILHGWKLPAHACAQMLSPREDRRLKGAGRADE